MQRKQSGTIKVFCRFRPFNSHEMQNNATKHHRVSNQQQLIIKGLKQEQVSFMFDRVFDMNSNQQTVFQYVGRPVLDNILQGFNGTIMAYGQTSSGKTHTMQGYDLGDKQLKGIMPRIIEELFDCIEKSPDSMEYKLKISIFELYMEKVRDLLDVSKNDLKVRENKNGPYVEDLTQIYVSNKMELLKLVQIGQKNRITCSTNMNDQSSRSHMIFLLSLNQFNQIDSASKTSKLFLIDLAGSQKISKTGAQGKVLEEAKKINLSLTSLGKVIKALSQKSQKNSHVPYRDSKLTRIIKDSLGGNSKTTLIVTCSPHQMHLPQTISTLRFGENAQKIKNKPKINKQLTVQELQKIIEKMQSQMSFKSQRVSVLEKYIQQELKASLPPTNYSIKQSQIKQEAQIQQSHNQEMDQIVDNQVVKDSQKTTQYQQKIKQLQFQMQEYKTQMKRQNEKFYQLKRQYASLHQNMRNLINQNLLLQETIQQNQKNKQSKLLNISQANQNNSNQQTITNNNQVLDVQTILKDIFQVVGKQVQNKIINKINSKQWYKNIKSLANGVSPFEKQQLKQKDNYINQQNNLQNNNQNNYLKTQRLTEITLSKQQKEDNKQFKQIDIQKILKQHQKKIVKRQNQKLFRLQSKLDQLYQQYHEMITLQTSWKVQCQLYERKLKQKEERIQKLQQMMEQLSEQVEMIQDRADTISIKTKIIKPIKGGLLFRK